MCLPHQPGRDVSARPRYPSLLQKLGRQTKKTENTKGVGVARQTAVGTLPTQRDRKGDIHAFAGDFAAHEPAGGDLGVARNLLQRPTKIVVECCEHTLGVRFRSSSMTSDVSYIAIAPATATTSMETISSIALTRAYAYGLVTISSACCLGTAPATITP